MHTTEHILNQTMVRIFGCGRAVSAHIERKKSKCDYKLDTEPTPQQLENIATQVNKIIAQHLPVTTNFIGKEEASMRFDLSKLPTDASNTLRIVSIGDYDSCPCIGLHVENTKEIGLFSIVSANYSEEILRIRFKLAAPSIS